MWHDSAYVPLLPIPIRAASRCYALTIHKTQAMSIAYLVRGCLEGIFAQGQVYVLVIAGG